MRRRQMVVPGIATAALVCLSGCLRGGKPEAPAIAAECWGVAGESWVSVVKAADPDADDVSFRFRRDGGKETDWTGFVESGDELEVVHVWDEPGGHDVRAQARDGRGRLSHWSGEFAVTVVPSPGFPDKAARSIGTMVGPRAIAVTADGERMYSHGEDWIASYDVATGQRLARAYPMPGYILGIALSGDGSVLYVAGRDRLLVLDATDLAVSDSVSVGARLVGLPPGGGMVYTVCEDTLFAIDAATHAVVDTVLLPASAGLLGFSPDGERCYLTAQYRLLVVSLPSGEQESITTPLRSPSGLVVAPDEEYLYLLDESPNSLQGMHVLRTADWRFVGSPILLYDEPPDDIAVMPSGDYLLVADAAGDRIVIFRTTDFAVVGRYDVRINECRLAVSPDGRLAFATDRYNARVRVLGYNSDQ